MEILKRGSIPERSHTFTCKGCRSKLRAKLSEGRRVQDWRDGDSYVFTCPVCTQETWVDARVIDGQ